MLKEKPANIALHVQPKAHQNEVVRFTNGVWYIKIASLDFPELSA